MSYTPNPTWVDGVNDVDAASMNHIEAGVKDASDRLDTVDANGSVDKTVRTAVFGNPANTTRILFKARLNGTLTLAQNTDVFAQANWTVVKDTHSGFHAGSTTSGDLSYWQAPYSRRYDILFHVQSNSGANDVVLLGAVEIDSPSINNSIARDTNEVKPNTELTANAMNNAYPINGAQKIYWSVWCQGGTITIGSNFGVDTFIVIKDAGPQ